MFFQSNLTAKLFLICFEFSNNYLVFVLNHQEILNLAKQRILALQNNEQGENMSEQMIFKMHEEKITRLEYIQKLLEKIYNGVIRKTWQFQGDFTIQLMGDVYNLRGKASSGDYVVRFGAVKCFDSFDYYLYIINGSNPSKVDIDL